MKEHKMACTAETFKNRNSGVRVHMISSLVVPNTRCAIHQRGINTTSCMLRSIWAAVERDMDNMRLPLKLEVKKCT